MTGPPSSASRAFHAGDGPVGVLLCHGFTGSPRSLRPWADHLVTEGFRVSLPLLTGHGTTWQELNRTPWSRWYADLEQALDDLRDLCPQVFVVGLSMGGALALRLAEQRPGQIDGLVVVNPALRISDPRMRILPVLKWAVPSLTAIAGDIARPGVTEGGYPRTPLRALHSLTRMWRDVVDHLDQVQQPLLVYRSAQDHVVDASSVELIRAGVRSTDTRYISLARSYHVATLDYEADEIFTGSVAFFRRLTRDRPVKE